MSTGLRPAVVVAASALLFAAACWAVAPGAAAKGDPTGPGGWEYKAVGFQQALDQAGQKWPAGKKLDDPETCTAITAALTHQGKEGWELAHVSPVEGRSLPIYYFKRRK